MARPLSPGNQLEKPPDQRLLEGNPNKIEIHPGLQILLGPAVAGRGLNPLQPAPRVSRDGLGSILLFGSPSLQVSKSLCAAVSQDPTADGPLSPGPLSMAGRETNLIKRSPEQSLQLLRITPLNHSLFVWGPPGMGKTEIVNQYARSKGAEVVTVRASEMESRI